MVAAAAAYLPLGSDRCLVLRKAVVHVMMVVMMMMVVMIVNVCVYVCVCV